MKRSKISKGLLKFLIILLIRNPQSTRAAQALANKARIQRQFLKNENESKRTLQSMVKRYGKVEGGGITH